MREKDNPIKILFITLRADYGGGPEHLFQLSSLLSNSFEKYIAAPKDFPYWEKYKQLVGEDHLIEIPHRKLSIKHILKLIKHIKKNDIKIIHSHGKGAGIYSRLINVFVKRITVHSFHGVHIKDPLTLTDKFYILIERYLCKLTNAIISTSSSEREKILKNRLVSNEKMNLIQNGVIIPSKTISEDNFNSKSLNVLTISRFDYAKNTELLFDVIQHLKLLNCIDKFKFIIIGSGELEKNYKKLAGEKNLNKHLNFLGNMESLENTYLSSFAYISTSRSEGMPLSILEAMSYGLPIIATEVTGNIDLVKNNYTGLLYKLSEPQKASEYLIAMAENFQLWSTLSRNEVTFVKENFNMEQMVLKTELLYNSLLGRNI